MQYEQLNMNVVNTIDIKGLVQNVVALEIISLLVPLYQSLVILI